MRFVVRRSAAIASSLPNGTQEYGTLVLPSTVLNDNAAERYAPLTRDGSYTVGGTVYHPYEIPAEDVLRSDADAVYYTVSIVNLPEEQYFRQFSARGYLTFRDLNGVTQTVYTDEYSANLYAAAKNALTNSDTPQTDRAVLTAAVHSGNSQLAAAYNSADRTTVLGSPSSPQTWVCRLNQSGINVREVNISSGRGGDAIDALSDANLSMLQKEVWDINPTALVTLGNHDFVNRTGKDLTSEQVYAALQDGWRNNIYYTFLGAPNMPEGATKSVYNLIVNSADVVKGVFAGHAHTDFYTEILGKTPNGTAAVIPQYTLEKSDADGGHVLKITVN